MKKKILKLGVMVYHKTSETIGMLTHYMLDEEGNEQYVYQPRGLNPKTKQPVDRILVTTVQMLNADLSAAEEDTIILPVKILGTKVEDIATGFRGTGVTLVYHINGCIHVEIKPAGLTEDGATIAINDFDIRRIKGDAISPLPDKKLKESIEKNPSPISTKGVGR